MLAMDAVGKEIVTIEGLSDNGDLHPLQKSFVDLGGLQCGFCTPGIIMTAKAVLDEEPRPTEENVKKKMAGNLCRCTGYKKVIESVLDAADRMGGQE
jgi:carbon-monoxide dehydrogenase small subunit